MSRVPHSLPLKSARRRCRCPDGRRGTPHPAQIRYSLLVSRMQAPSILGLGLDSLQVTMCCRLPQSRTNRCKIGTRTPKLAQVRRRLVLSLMRIRQQEYQRYPREPAVVPMSPGSRLHLGIRKGSLKLFGAQARQQLLSQCQHRLRCDARPIHSHRAPGNPTRVLRILTIRRPCSRNNLTNEVRARLSIKTLAERRKAIVAPLRLPRHMQRTHRLILCL